MNSAENGQATGAASASASSVPVIDPATDCTTRNIEIATGAQNRSVTIQTPQTRPKWAIAICGPRHSAPAGERSPAATAGTISSSSGIGATE